MIQDNSTLKILAEMGQLVKVSKPQVSKNIAKTSKDSNEYLSTQTPTSSGPPQPSLTPSDMGNILTHILNMPNSKKYTPKD